MKKNCATPDCKNRALKYRQLCATCRSRELKKKHPVTYFFNLLRINARIRGKELSITLDQFKQFAIENEYIRGRYKTKTLSIDRIDASRG